MNKRLLYTIVLAAVLTLPLTALAQTNNCIECHQAFEAEGGPSYKFSRGVHFQNDILCQDCHGGDPSLEDMDEVRKNADYVGIPDHLDIPDFCAGCHSDPAYMHEHDPGLPTDQLSKYKTSVHGRLLFENNNSDVANCVSCHGVHDIGDAKMPHSSTHPQNLAQTCGKCHADEEYMSDYGIPTDQVSEYLTSVHGKALMEDGDLGAPACNDCHGNHGASPPGVASLTAVCGNCHAFQMELFTASPHGTAFEEYDFPMCGTCHGNHAISSPTDEWVGTDEPAVCVQCHSSDDGTEAFTVAAGISQTLDSLKSARNNVQEKVAKADELGMMTTDQEFALKDITQNLIQTRTTVHSFSLEKVTEQASEGFAKAQTALEEAKALVEEYYFRRKGLGFATLFITILAISLYIKIRRLD